MLARRIPTSLALIAGGVLLIARDATAVDYTWNVLGGGTQAWNSAANWNPSSGIPNASADTVNFGVGLAADLTVDLDAVTTSGSTIIGSGSFGGTSSAVTTNVTGTSWFILGQSAQAANVSIGSVGVAGSVNKISAPVLFGKNTDFPQSNTRDFTIAGPVIGQSGVSATVTNFMNGGQTLTIGSGSSSLIQLYEVLVPGNARTLTLQNSSNSTGSGTGAQTTVVNASWGGGPSATGQMIFGNSNQNPVAVYRLMVSQTSPANVVINRQAYELLADNVFGTGTVTSSNNNNQNWGTTLKAVGGDRSIGNAKFLMSNPFAVTGSNSVTFANTFTQGSNRVLGNNLPSGKQVNLNGVVAIDNTTSARTMTFEGTGKTVINGQIINNITGDNVPGTVLKKGDGRLEVKNATNTLSGTWQANGGLIVFGTAGSYGTALIRTSTGGGVSYAPGTADAGWATFASRLTGSGTNYGFLALPAADAAANLDFTTTLAGAPSLSVVGDGDMTYTGVVTPGSAGYNWGGTSGVLTLPASACTGANTVKYTNGGTVVIAGSQSYTGATTVQGVQMITSQVGITSGTGASATGSAYNLPTTLTVDSLGNAGSASSLGASSNAASNLVIDRATLKVTGGSPSSTDRLFTVGPNGATIESAGAGLISLGSGGGANVGPSSAAVLTLTGTGNGVLDSILADGAGVLSIVKAGSGTWTLNGISTYSGTTNVSAGKLIVNGVLGSGSLAISSGATLAGTGTITTLVFGAGSTLTFDPASTLTVSSTARFQSPSTFGVDDILGLSSSTPDSIYTLIAGNVDTTNLSNFGSSNAYNLGGGKTAYFQSASPSGLSLVVVPEPTSIAAVISGLGIMAFVLRRRDHA